MTKGCVLWEVRQEDQEFRVVLGYIVSSRPAEVFIYFCTQVWAHMCREVRGQLCGVSSFLPPFLGSRFAQQVPLLSE